MVNRAHVTILLQWSYRRSVNRVRGLSQDVPTMTTVGSQFQLGLSSRSCGLDGRYENRQNLLLHPLQRCWVG